MWRFTHLTLFVRLFVNENPNFRENGAVAARKYTVPAQSETLVLPLGGIHPSEHFLPSQKTP
jgi:hypothetical protein